MRINEGFELRTVCGEHLIVAYGRKNIDFSKVISLNESAAYLWRSIEDKDFTTEDLAKLLCQEYEVDEATALADATRMVENWKEVGLVG